MEWPSAKKNPVADRAPSRLHELARDVVDRGDVVRIHGVTQPEAPGEGALPSSSGKAGEGEQRPGPGGEIRQQQEAEQEEGAAPYRSRHASRHARAPFVALRILPPGVSLGPCAALLVLLGGAARADDPAARIARAEAVVQAAEARGVA